MTKEQTEDMLLMIEQLAGDVRALTTEVRDLTEELGLDATEIFLRARARTENAQMTTVAELREISQRKKEIRDDYDVQMLELIDIITKAYQYSTEFGRLIGDNRRKRIAERLQKSAEDSPFDYRDQGLVAQLDRASAF